jgi:hypothetical protein
VYNKDTVGYSCEQRWFNFFDIQAQQDAPTQDQDKEINFKSANLNGTTSHHAGLRGSKLRISDYTETLSIGHGNSCEHTIVPAALQLKVSPYLSLNKDTAVLTKTPNFPIVTTAAPMCSTRFRARKDASFSMLPSCQAV